MTRALALFALALLLVACGVAAPAPARVLPARAQALQSETAVWRVVGKVGDWNVDLTIYQQSGGVVETASPTPAATLPASATATPTPPLTNTPRPSPQASVTLQFTPSATMTPDDTFTPDATPTPPATSTPGISTPAPDTKLCEAVVAIPGGVNVRTAASTASTIKAKAPQGSRQVVDQFVTAGGYLWAHLPTLAGYMVVGQYINPFAWWVSFNSNEFCDTKPGWDFNVPAPPEVAAIQAGLHVLIGANAAPIYSTLPTWGVLKCLNGTEHICLEAKRRSPNLTIIFRALNTCQGMADGPQMAGWYNPSTWFGCIRGYWPEGFDYYEIINEVGPPGDDYALMAQFNIDLARLAGAEGKCILAFSFGPGNPEIARWSALLPYLLWANEHPCGPGKYHGIALHQTAYLPASVPLQVGQWVNSVWVSGRDWIVDGYLQLNHGFSLKDFRGPLYITELGLSDGYSGSWDDKWSCAQVALSIAETKDRLAARSYVTGFNWWNIGGVVGGRWTDDSSCLGDMARALQ